MKERNLKDSSTTNEQEVKQYEFDGMTCLVKDKRELSVLKNGDIVKFYIPYYYKDHYEADGEPAIFFANGRLFILQKYYYQVKRNEYIDAHVFYEANLLTQKMEKLWDEKELLSFSFKGVEKSGFVMYESRSTYPIIYHIDSKKSYGLPADYYYNPEEFVMVDYQEDNAIIKDLHNKKYYVYSRTCGRFTYDYEEYDEVINFLAENNTKPVDCMDKINALAVDKKTIPVLNNKEKRYRVKNTENGSYIYDFFCRNEREKREKRYFMPDITIDTKTSIELICKLSGNIAIFRNVDIDKYYLFINEVLVYEYDSEENEKVKFNFKENCKCIENGTVAVVPIGDKLCIWNPFTEIPPLVVDDSTFKKFE